MKIINEAKTPEENVREGSEEKMDVFLRAIIDGKDPHVVIKENCVLLEMQCGEINKALVTQEPDDLKCLLYRAYLLGRKDSQME